MKLTQKPISLAAAIGMSCILTLPITGIKSARADDGTAYSWSLPRIKGEVSRYRQRAVVTGLLPDGTNLDAHIKMINKQEVKDVKENGDALVVETVESRTIIVNGNKIPEDPSSYTIFKRTFSNTGLVLKSTVENAPAGSETLAQMSSMLRATPIPDKPVKIGDSWTTEIVNTVVPGKKVKFTSTADSIEKVAGVDTLKIKVKLTFPIQANAAEADFVKADGSYNIDPKTGRLMRSAFDVVNTLIPSPIGELKANTSSVTELIVAGVNDKEEDDIPTAKGK